MSTSVTGGIGSGAKGTLDSLMESRRRRTAPETAPETTPETTPETAPKIGLKVSRREVLKRLVGAVGAVGAGLRSIIGTDDAQRLFENLDLEGKLLHIKREPSISETFPDLETIEGYLNAANHIGILSKREGIGKLLGELAPSDLHPNRIVTAASYVNKERVNLPTLFVDAYLREKITYKEFVALHNQLKNNAETVARGRTYALDAISDPSVFAITSPSDPNSKSIQWSPMAHILYTIRHNPDNIDPERALQAITFLTNNGAKLMIADKEGGKDHPYLACKWLNELYGNPEAEAFYPTLNLIVEKSNNLPGYPMYSWTSQRQPARVAVSEGPRNSEKRPQGTQRFNLNNNQTSKE